MRVLLRCACCVLVVAGCRSGDPRAVRELYGEVHIHGFANGFHPCATFTTHGVRADTVNDVSIWADRAPRRSGSCAIATSAQRTNIPTMESIDAGILRIAGGTVVPRIELAFQPATATYLATPELPMGTPLFSGGEPLRIDVAGSTAAAAFSGVVEAPRPLELTGPAKLQLTSGGLVVTWKPDHADHVEIALVASTTDGRWTAIRCTAHDDDGRFTFSPSLLAELPSAPRDLQLEATRNQVVRAASAVAGRGVILHASYAVKLSAHED